MSVQDKIKDNNNDVKNAEIVVQKQKGKQGQKDSSFKKSKFDIIKAVVNQKNGIMISDEYIDGKSKLKIQCENAHVFEMVPGNIIGNHWCRMCVIENPNSVLSLSEAKKMIFLIKLKSTLKMIYLGSVIQLLTNTKIEIHP